MPRRYAPRNDVGECRGGNLPPAQSPLHWRGGTAKRWVWAISETYSRAGLTEIACRQLTARIPHQSAALTASPREKPLADEQCSPLLLRQTGGGNTLDFFYNESGYPYALKHNGTTYYYVTNLQGDVLAILYKDENNAIHIVASYTYDPYGKPTISSDTTNTTLAEINPLRYRGYYYDTETGLYYLQSRYYDPTTCRFINADSYASTGQGIIGYNMFAYCRNNPVSRKDASGTEDVSVEDFNEDDNPLNDLGNPSGGGGGRGLGVKSSYYTSQRVQAYDWQWQNSAYNLSPTSSSGTSTNLESISTGRTEPANLQEKLAMESAKSNPSAGKMILEELKDPRFPNYYSKFQQTFDTAAGRIVIHYVGNKAINQFVDFKFK